MQVLMEDSCGNWFTIATSVNLDTITTGVAWNVRRVLAKTPSRRHFESKRTSKTGSTSKIGSRNGFR